MNKQFQIDDEITLADLLLMNEKNDVVFIDNCFDSSKFWRPNYKSLQKRIPEGFTWYKDRQLTAPVKATLVDMVSFLELPSSFSSAIMFRTSAEETWKNMQKTASITFQLKDEHIVNDVKIFEYFNDHYFVKMAIANGLYSVIVMQKKDHDKGINLQ